MTNESSKKALENALVFASLCNGSGLASVELELEDLARARLSGELRQLTAEDARQFCERLYKNGVAVRPEPVK